LDVVFSRFRCLLWVHLGKNQMEIILMGEIFVSCIVLHNAGPFVGTIIWTYLLSDWILIESIK
jgi:hypothetical protein